MTLKCGGLLKMKKKSLILILLSFFCLMVLSSGRGFMVSSASSLDAEDEIVKEPLIEPTITFEVSNGSSGKFLIENEEFSVSNSYGTWQDVLSLVSSKTQSEDIVCLNFSNLDLDQASEATLYFRFDRFDRHPDPGCCTCLSGAL